MKRLALLSLCAFVAASISLDALNLSDYRFHSMPETSYYGGVHSIAKDSVGRIWFTGSDAVYMYDGISFSRFNEKLTDKAPGAYWTFLQVVRAADNMLYIGTNNGLMRFDYMSMDFECILDGNISYLACDDDGMIWMIRNDSIESWSTLEHESSHRYPFPEEMSVSPLTLSLSCSGADVYISSGQKTYILNPASGDYTLFSEINVPDCVIRDIEEYEGYRYALTARHGIWRFTSGGTPIEHYSLPKEYEKSTVAKELYLDRAGGILWAATQSGLFLVDLSSGRTQMLRMSTHYPYSLPNNSVWTIYPDPVGGVWIGTYGGKLAYMPVSDSGGNWFKATPGGLSHSIVSCFEEDDKGNIWIGTEGGGINYWDRINDRFICYTQENNSGVRSNMIKKLYYDGHGRLLMSSFNGGMQVYDKTTDRFVDFVKDVEFPAYTSVYDFVEDGKYGYWISDPDSPLRYLNIKGRNIEKRNLTHGGIQLRPRIENMFRDKSGSISLVTSRGLYVINDDGTVTGHHYLKDAPFAKNDLCCYHIAADGGVWLGTRGGGLNVLMKDGSYVSFYDRNGNGLEGKTIFGILDDETTGDLWMSTDDGLYVYDKSEDVFRRSTIDVHNLCGAYYVRSCFKTKKGEMLFGGTDGFIIFDPSKIGSNVHKPTPFFVNLKVNSEIVRTFTEGPVILSHRQSNFEITFSSDSYQDADKNIYAYRMLGLSDNWNILPQGQRSVAFYDIPSGKYTFELKAANGDGLWGDKVISISFKVSPPPYLSIWAYIIYLMVGSVSALLVSLYVRHKKRFKEELDQKDAELSDLYKKKYVAGPSEIVVTSMEDELLKKALACVEKNMDNSEYGVEDFVSDMAMGRTVLYQKINNITGLSIKEFILDIRLKRAATLLKESDRTVSEISYMTGFINPKYFSTIFRKRYGATPSAYRKSLG